MRNHLLATALLSLPLHGAFTLSFSDADFGTTPVFSNVSTFALEIVSPDNLMAGGSIGDPGISDIQYSVSGTLTATPSGFPAFAFGLDDRFPSSPPITGAQFYALNPDAAPGATIAFQISPTANLGDGLQLDELTELPEAQFGPGVIFHFDGRERDTARYHPMFLQLRSDGTGILQNSNNSGGNNPFDTNPGEIDVDFGEEYITNLTFSPSAVTVVIPEPSTSSVFFLAMGFALSSRRRKA